MKNGFWFGFTAAVLIGLFANTPQGASVWAADNSQDGSAAKDATSNKEAPKSSVDANGDQQRATTRRGSRSLVNSLGWVIQILGDIAEVATGEGFDEEAGRAARLDENDPEVLQMVVQCQPYVKSELGYVRLICPDLTPEQRQLIREAASSKLKVFVVAMCREEGLGGPQIIPFDLITTDQITDPAVFIRRTLLETLPKILSADQMAAFREETEKRTGSRKMAVILGLVAHMDAQMFLSDDQKKKIQDSIAKAWKPSWESWAVITVGNSNEYLPQVPDNCVAPHLNPDQKAVWTAMAKVDFGWWNGGEEMVANRQEDEWWGFPEDADVPAGGLLGAGMRGIMVLNGEMLEEAEVGGPVANADGFSWWDPSAWFRTVFPHVPPAPVEDGE